MVAASPTTSIEHATAQQLAGLCLEFQFDVAEWAVLSHDRVLMMSYFLEKAGSVVDDPRGTRWYTGDRVQVTEHGIEAIEGSQLLLPPSVVAVIHAQMELQESIDQVLVDAVLPGDQPQLTSLEPPRPNPFSKQPSKQSKRKKQTTPKVPCLERPAVTPAKKHSIGELEALETSLPDISQLRIPKKKRADSSQESSDEESSSDEEITAQTYAVNVALFKSKLITFFVRYPRSKMLWRSWRRIQRGRACQRRNGECGGPESPNTTSSLGR